MQKIIHKPKYSTVSRVGAALLLAVLVTTSSYPGQQKATAAATCSSITECTTQINNNNNQVSSLRNEAVSYKDAITRLSSTIGQTRGSIANSQAQQANLEKQITDAQTQIDSQKSLLGENLRTMYVEGQISTIESLATSSNLSDYVDKEENRTAVQNSIQSTLTKISDLQAKLQTQKSQVVSLLAQQRSQASQLESDQAQQSSMLSYNQSQQSSYNSQTAANQSKLAALIAAQRTANVSSKGGYYFIRFAGSVRAHNPGSNDYPYSGSGFSMSTAPGCNDNDGPDRWGYCDRQCVSYTAWAVERSGRSAPRYWGNAKNWVAAAKRSGVPVYNVPQAGDVAISTAGTWGHAMYVESVSGNKIFVSQYNQQLNGQYSTQWRQWQ